MRSMRRKRAASPKTGPLLRLIKAALFGCVITVAILLVFALLLKWELFGESSIPAATSIIKAFCALCTGLIVARSTETRPWLWAGFGGMLYIAMAFVAFSLVEKVLSISAGLLADIALGFLAGAAGGMLQQAKKA
jgi:putative membrane protein (TIGR04086 family)